MNFSVKFTFGLNVSEIKVVTSELLPTPSVV